MSKFYETASDPDADGSIAAMETTALLALVRDHLHRSAPETRKCLVTALQALLDEAQHAR